MNGRFRGPSEALLNVAFVGACRLPRLTLLARISESGFGGLQVPLKGNPDVNQALAGSAKSVVQLIVLHFRQNLAKAHLTRDRALDRKIKTSNSMIHWIMNFRFRK
jgi:hypothetical protein